MGLGLILKHYGKHHCLTLAMMLGAFCTVQIHRVDPRVNVRVATTTDADAWCVYALRSTISANVIP